MSDRLDAVELEVVRHQLEGIATEMGRTLIRGAFSPNIKERQDCSTALFDPGGRMVAQAEHIPVHLGAMPDAVAAVLAMDPAPNSAYLTNDPYRGGTHLPDLTVIAPLAPHGTVIGVAAVRAHHDDVGGATPGSLPAGSRNIFAEGMRIPPVPIEHDGEIEGATLDVLLANVRHPESRRADLRAQLGAVRLAERRLEELLDRYGESGVREAFEAIIEYSMRRTRRAIDELADGTYTARDHLEGDGHTDDPIPIAVEVTVDGASIHVDFAGTAEQVAGNVNAPPAVTKSAVYFVIRCVTDPDIPSNHGCFEPVDIQIPPGSVLDPDPPAAVSGGNVETSQRVADVTLEALRGADPSMPAHGQGTMNNLVIGPEDGEAGTYYETIGGGSGARPSLDGIDGVHVGMTNTLNTPVEALEQAYPFVVERYALRPDSGGRGRHRGGLGIERAVRVLTDATVSILSDRRETGPPGADGGEPGSTGANRVGGEPVGSKVTVDIDAGTVVRILTPGGGGYGPPDEREPDLIDSDRLDGKETRS